MGWVGWEVCRQEGLSGIFVEKMIGQTVAKLIRPGTDQATRLEGSLAGREIRLWGREKHHPTSNNS